VGAGRNPHWARKQWLCAGDGGGAAVLVQGESMDRTVRFTDPSQGSFPRLALLGWESESASGTEPVQVFSAAGRESASAPTWDRVGVNFVPTRCQSVAPSQRRWKFYCHRDAP
jgi:hypothetical protein